MHASDDENSAFTGQVVETVGKTRKQCPTRTTVHYRVCLWKLCDRGESHIDGCQELIAKSGTLLLVPVKRGLDIGGRLGPKADIAHSSRRRRRRFTSCQGIVSVSPRSIWSMRRSSSARWPGVRGSASGWLRRLSQRASISRRRSSGVSFSMSMAAPLMWICYALVVGATTGGTPKRIRTSDLQIRSLSLYPAELWAHEGREIVASREGRVNAARARVRA